MSGLHVAHSALHGSSPIHRLDPRTKIVTTLAFVFAAALLPRDAWPAYALLLAATVAVAHAAGLGAGFALRRSFVALPFVLAALTLPFTVPGEPLARLGPLTASVEGSVRLAGIVLKSWVSVQAAILLAHTTAFHDLLWGLRALRLPAVLVSVVGFMYRYLFVLSDEAARLMRARASRSGVSGEAGRRAGGSLLWRGRVAGGLVGSLTLRAFERSERIHDAMAARGFTGELKTLEPPTLTDADRNALVVAATFLTMASLIGWIF